MNKRKKVDPERIIINKKMIDRGYVLQSRKIKAFKLFWTVYTTNLKRERLYSFDDPSWEVVRGGFMWKLKMLFNGKLRAMK
jgi:hypothetical protein